MDVVKIPGPDHPISVTPSARRFRVSFQGVTVAESADVLMLKEAHYKEVGYFPRVDAEMSHFVPTALDTYCPYKGHAAYFSLKTGGAVAENAVWTYEAPHPAMAAIAGRLAFYPNLVEITEV